MKQGVEAVCAHEEECSCEAPKESGLFKEYGNDEIGFAFLLALMPLVVLSFFGQAGLI